MDSHETWSPHRRAARITYLLLHGEQLTTGEIAHRLCMSRQGVWYLMDNISSELPVEYVGGKWRILAASRRS